MVEAESAIETGEGALATFVARPESIGPHPVVRFLMDAPDERPLLHFFQLKA